MRVYLKPRRLYNTASNAAHAVPHPTAVDSKSATRPHGKNAMSFYQELSRHYDDIFAVDQAEMRFIAALLEGARHLLDIGCGTGNRTEHLAAPGRRIIGIDLDEGMIARAKAKKAAGLNGIDYDVLDMTEIDKKFKGTAFDGMVCLGNTLVHLPVEGISRMIGKAHALLVDGGLLVIQILNYDRILDNGICTLPDIDTKQATFTRAYSRACDGLHFLTSLRLKECGRVFHNDIILFPLRRNTLAGMLADAGFHTPDWYGSYSGTPLNQDSFVAIAACRK